MKRKFMAILLCCFLALQITPIYADNHGNNGAAEETNNQNRRNWLTAGGGCVGGAILGSFLPIIGNAIGCVAGGVAGYFVPNLMTGDNDPGQPAGAALLQKTNA